MLGLANWRHRVLASSYLESVAVGLFVGGALVLFTWDNGESADNVLGSVDDAFPSANFGVDVFAGRAEAAGHTVDEAKGRVRAHPAQGRGSAPRRRLT